MNTRSAPGLPIILLSTLSVLVCGTAAKAATIVVDTLDDANAVSGGCTLREAIVAANSDAAGGGCPAGDGADTIDLTGLTGVIELGSDLPLITDSVDIVGPGAFDLAVDGDGNRIFLFQAADTSHSISDLTMTGANGVGAAVFTITTGTTVVIRDCRIVDNDLDTIPNGAIRVGISSTIELRRSIVAFNDVTAGSGSAIVVQGTLLAYDSTIANNTTDGDGGGMIVASPGTAILDHSTVSGNVAGGVGGGIWVSIGDLELYHSTVTDNEAGEFQERPREGAFELGSEDGGGIYVSSTAASTLLLFNSIVAGNRDVSGIAADDLFVDSVSPATTLGFNLIGDNTGASFYFPSGLPNVNGDYVGSAATPLAAGLMDLADNGGPTPTHLPDPATSAVTIDGGSCPGVFRDQRGYFDGPTGHRPVDGPPPNGDDGCDIGSVELGAVESATIFEDGFESGDTSAWSTTLP